MGKLIMIFATDAVTPVVTLENLNQVFVRGVIAIFDEIVFHPYSYIADVGFVDGKIVIELLWLLLQRHLLCFP